MIIHKNQKQLIQKAGSTNGLVDQAIRTVKKIATELRPGLLDDLGIAAAIEWYANDFKNRTGIQVETKINPSVINLQIDLSTAIFRIFQESLTNVARHSRATAVIVFLRKNDSTIELILTDNGVGITKAQAVGRNSLGILGIKERVHIFGGKVVISSLPGEGTTVRVVIPFN